MRDAQQPRDELEIALLRLYQTLPARERIALVDALIRKTDGKPLEECAVELAVELGYYGARLDAQKVLDERVDWLRATTAHRKCKTCGLRRAKLEETAQRP
jgi:hypothetical protein